MGRPFNVLTNVAGSLRRFLGAEGPLSFRDEIKNPVRARRGMTQTASSAVGAHSLQVADLSTPEMRKLLQTRTVAGVKHRLAGKLAAKTGQPQPFNCIANN